VTAYALLWALLKHVLHGRGRDEVFLMAGGDERVNWRAAHFAWAGDDDAFCLIQAVQQ
jgi:hypothetical protein